MSISKSVITTPGQLFLRDTRLPGTNLKAPMAMWGFLAFCILGGIGATIWIYSYQEELE